MSIELLERAAAALGLLCEEVVFVGGATLPLWITNPAAPAVRPTYDVDVIAEVTTRADYYRFEDKLRNVGFRDDGNMIGRWRYGRNLLLDAIPADASIIGFENEWQRRAIPEAAAIQLPSGAAIRVVSPPFLVATKLEAFSGRGRADYYGSRDFGDVVSLLDGRDEIVAEIERSPGALRTYLASELIRIRDAEAAIHGIYAQLRPDAASQARATAVVLPRIERIIDSGQSGR